MERGGVSDTGKLCAFAAGWGLFRMARMHTHLRHVVGCRVMMAQISVATVCVQVALQTRRMILSLSRVVLILCSVHTGASREYS